MISFLKNLFKKKPVVAWDVYAGTSSVNGDDIKIGTVSGDGQKAMDDAQLIYVNWIWSRGLSNGEPVFGRYYLVPVVGK